MEDITSSTDYDIAIIGMDCRFPDADNVNQYWRNLKQNLESVTFFTKEELIEAGIDSEILEDKNYVKANAIIKDDDKFDAAFFGYSPREAELMDPQQRLFLECVWHTLEDGGYVPGKYKGLIGVFAGSGSNTYFTNNICKSKKVLEDNDLFNTMLCNEKDFLTTRTSYKLNLKGPSLNIQTACSTSLVAVHEACQSLLDGECDMAIAGGVNLNIPEIKGYMYLPGMIYSPDGHCRAFDQSANGTIGGNGVGTVLLKPLQLAIEDNDNIYAVIKGSAINNDGADKIGFTAPSIDGQAYVIKEALNVSGVAAEDIGYVETHGTATPLGDSIEISALKQAYSESHSENHPLYIGSVKTNVGHLGAAAGIAGLIKAVCCVKYGIIPASLNIENSNSCLDESDSHICVCDKNIEWKTEGKRRVAAVSAFGLGGTNAHLIVSEYQSVPQKERQELPYNLIVLSGKKQESLHQIQTNISQYLDANPKTNLYDLARNLQSCRESFSYRKYISVTDIKELKQILDDKSPNRRMSENKVEGHKKVVFMFSSIQAEFYHMGRGLYCKFETYRKIMDQCCELVEESYGIQIQDIILAEQTEKEIDTKDLLTQQLMNFVFQYALATFFIRIGVKPDQLIGYSFGEYAAACVSGIMSLEDAIQMIVMRAKLIQTIDKSAMLSVPFQAKDLQEFLSDQMEIAIDNEDSCVVSGTQEAISMLEDTLKKKSIMTMRIDSLYAMHSNLMKPIVNEYEKALSTIHFKKAKRNFVSAMAYDKCGQQDVSTPKYWANHLMEQVHFFSKMKEMDDLTNTIFVEIGSGRNLNNLMSRIVPTSNTIQTVVHAGTDESNVKMFTNAVAKIWSKGIEIKWNKLYQSPFSKLSLPGYPFEKKTYWISPDDITENKKLEKRADANSWYYCKGWKNEYVNCIDHDVEDMGKIVLFMNKDLPELYQSLLKTNSKIICVYQGEEYQVETENHIVINPEKVDDYVHLFQHLKEKNDIPNHIIHLWSITNEEEIENEAELDDILNLSFFSVINIVQGILSNDIKDNIKLSVLSNHIHNVTGEEKVCYIKSNILGAVKIIPVENMNIDVKSIEIKWDNNSCKNNETICNSLIQELFFAPDHENIIALRGNYRWKQEIRSLKMPHKNHLRIKRKGMYLILGGFGGMGFSIAKYLAHNYEADITLVGRSNFPKRDQWEDYKGEKYSKQIADLLELEKMGCTIKVHQADVSNDSDMKMIIEEIYTVYGSISGIIHAAGVRDMGGIIQNRKKPDYDAYMDSKVKGIWILDRLIKNKKVGFLLLCSSIGNILYKNKFGQVAYNAANECLEAYSEYADIATKIPTFTINWCDWLETGMAMKVVEEQDSFKNKFIDYDAIIHGVTPTEGTIIFDRVVNQSAKKVIISPRDLIELVKRHAKIQRDLSSYEELVKLNITDHLYERPELSSTYEEAHTEVEKKLEKIFETIFKMESIGINDDFFELGGDSLKAMTLLAIIRKQFNVEINLKSVYKNSSIKRLAELIEGSEKNNYINILSCKKMEEYPLSSAQKRLYILQEMNPSSISYNMSMSWIIEGEVDLNYLTNVLHKLIKRHESLRTSFEMRKDQLVQIIHDDVEVKIQYQDMTECKDMDQKIQSMIEEYSTPFDLSSAPLVRTLLMKKNQFEYILMLNIHHIISDGTSLHGILRSDFIRLYQNEELPKLKLQYKDYAVWQAEQQSSSLKKEEQYWLSQLSDQLPVLKLPTDYKRPKEFSFLGDEYDFSLSKEMTADLKKICTKNGYSLFMVLLSAFGVLLYKYTSQEDMIVGTSIEGRNNSNLTDIIGMFVNQLALRIKLKDTMSFDELLKQVHSTCLDAYENQNVQFDQLVDKLNLVRDTSRNPIFDVSFVFHNEKNYKGLQDYMTITTNNKEINFRPYNIATKYAKYDMTWFAYENDDVIHMSIEYCTSLFTKETIEEYSNFMIKIIEQINKNSSLSIEDIHLFDAISNKKILSENNNTDTELPTETVIDLFQQVVEQCPDKAALLCDGTKVTYDQLNRGSNQLANYLNKGICALPNEKIGILMDDSIEMVIAIYGIQKANTAFVPLDPQLPEERLQYIIDDAKIHTILLTKEYVKLASKLQWCSNSIANIICVNSDNIFQEIDLDTIDVERDLWNYRNTQTTNDTDDRCLFNGYTGEPLSQKEMDEYTDNVIHKLSPYINKDKSILEIGCASGFIMYEIAPKVKVYYGTDICNSSIEKNKNRIDQEGITNICVKCMPAHLINEIDYQEKFDVIIINNVIQYFSDYNYLRRVILNSIEVLKDDGIIFFGDVMDLDQKEDLITEIKEFKKKNDSKNTKLDFSQELFVPKRFFEDVAADMPELQEIQFMKKIGTIQNKLTKFRYDVMISVHKHSNKVSKYKKVKNGFDKRDIERYSDQFIKLCTPESLAYIIYTSGTTGKPKGTLIQHKSLYNYIRWAMKAYIDEKPYTMPLFTPLSFDLTLTTVYLPIVTQNVMAIYKRSNIGVTLVDIIEDNDCNIIKLTPSHIKIIQSMSINSDFKIEKMIVGGEQFDLDLAEDIYQKSQGKIRMFNEYGPTEATIGCMIYEFLPNQKYGDAVLIGKPIDNVQIYILDHSMQPIPYNAIGEIYIGGDCLSQGYLNCESLNQEKFIKNIFDGTTRLYKTGDLARRLRNSNVEYISRTDDQIKVLGHRVEVYEVKKKIKSFGGMKDVIVLSRMDDHQNTYMSAYLVTDHEVNIKKLRSYLESKLPDYMIPTYISTISSVPLTHNGKIDYKMLPDIVQSKHYVGPRNEYDRNLMHLWSELLNIDQNKISIHDNFFEIGGNSLLATILTVKIRKVFDIHISLVTIFKTLTLRELSDYLHDCIKTKGVTFEKAKECKYYTASRAQRRIYLAEQMNSNSILYNTPIIVRLIGKLSLHRLENAIKKLVERHESFRTTFKIQNSELVQEISPLGKVDFTLYGKEDNFQIFEFIRPFQFDTLPLVRFALVEENENKHLFVIDLHHIIADGISMNIIYKDIAQLYDDIELPQLQYQYKDYSEWEKKYEESNEYQQVESYWLNEFCVPLPNLQLPYDFEYQQIGSYKGKYLQYDISAESTSLLKHIAQEEKMTVYTVLFSVFFVLLHKITGQNDITVGTDTSGRRQDEVLDVVGMFVNLLPVRIQVEKNESFCELLQRVNSKLLNDIDNETYQYDRLIETLSQKNDKKTIQLVNVNFSFHNYLDSNINSLGDMKLELCSAEVKDTKFDIEVNCYEEDEKICIQFGYRIDLFKESTITTIAEYYLQLIQDIITDKSIGIDSMGKEESQDVFDHADFIL